MNLSKLSAILTAAFLLVSLAGCSGGAASSSLSASGSSPLPSAGNSDGTPASLTITEDTGTLVLSSAIPVEELSFTDRELDGSFDTASATLVTLTDDGSTISGRGATVSGNTVTISAAGTYLLSGSLSSGQIVVDASTTDKIQLVLQGVDITCPDNAAIYIKQADKVFLTVVSGTKNTISCGETFSDAAQQAEITGAIFSKDDLAINGTGTLIINGNAQHGIVSKDDLSIADTSIIVTAASDGIRGKDCVRIASGTFSITAGSDGIQSNNDSDTALGYVYITGGSFSITAANDGIQAETLLCITDGTFSIQTGGGSASAETNLGSSWEDFFRRDRHDRDYTQTDSSSDTVASDSFKGLKAGSSLVIAGGTMSVDSADDAIHCDADIAVREGSTITLASGDDGIHAESLLSISGGTITVSESYEGLEGRLIQISGGTLSITARDDGLNATDGSGGLVGFGGMRGGFFGSSTSSGNAPTLLISGGRLYVNADGDGLDSNGYLNVTGGEVYVDGPTNSGNGALDCGDGYEASISGGTLVAVGASGMAETFGSGSTQCSMLAAFGTSIPANTELTVTDSSGSIILTYTPAKTYQCAVISAPQLKTGETYTVTAGSASVQIEMTSVTASSSGSQGGFGSGGGMAGGFGGKGDKGGNRGDRDFSNAGGTTPNLPSSSQTPSDIPQRPDGGSFPNGEMMQPPTVPADLPDNAPAARNPMV